MGGRASFQYSAVPLPYSRSWNAYSVSSGIMREGLVAASAFLVAPCSSPMLVTITLTPFWRAYRLKLATLKSLTSPTSMAYLMSPSLSGGGGDSLRTDRGRGRETVRTSPTFRARPIFRSGVRGGGVVRCFCRRLKDRRRLCQAARQSWTS